jgi:DME family drug/metabolite transporter
MWEMPRGSRPLPAPTGLWPGLGIVGAACLWGTTGTAQELGPSGTSPLVVGSVRIVAGAVGLLVVASARRTWPAASLLRHVPLLVAGASMAAYQLLLFSGVRRTGVALGTVIGIGSTPVWAGLLAVGLRRERPGIAWVAGTAVAITGCVVLFGRGGDAVDARGVALTAGAGLSYAVYTTAVKALADAGHGAAQVVAASFGIGALLLVPVLVVGDLHPFASGEGIALTLWLGLVSVTVAYLLFGWGIAGVGVAAAATLTLAEPVTAATLGIAVLDEPATGSTIAGIALVVAGLLVAGRRGS